MKGSTRKEMRSRGRGLLEGEKEDMRGRKVGWGREKREGGGRRAEDGE